MNNRSHLQRTDTTKSKCRKMFLYSFFDLFKTNFKCMLKLNATVWQQKLNTEDIVD